MLTPAQKNRAYTLASWQSQKAWQPTTITRGAGIYIYDADGKRYLDWSSQLVNVNIGHSHPHVVAAIQAQAAQLCYVNPSFGTEPRGRLGEMLAEVTPGSLTKTFFTNAGAEAVENAMKIAQLYTGKHKIFSRYKSYHGGTYASAAAGGDPRRLANVPAIPWIIRMPDPYAYRNPVYRGRTQEEGDLLLAELIEEMVIMEGPQYCAAILIEGYSGSSGVMQPSPVFFTRMREICDRYEMVLIVDEVMSGFGRTGEWFGIDHYPTVQPDILAIAKGITSGYVPLGATIVTDAIADFFEENTLWAGLTYSAHALACAAGIANIEVYRAENLIDNSREMGRVLRAGLEALAQKHPVIGDIRGTGLHQVIELVKNRDTREPLSGFNAPLSEPMQKVSKALKDGGISTIVRWNYVFNTPPLVINADGIAEGLAILDAALTHADPYYEG